MPLVSTEKMLREAQKGGYAVGAFNMENMEMAQAILSAAEAAGSPVILQTTPSTVRYGGPWVYPAIAEALCRDARVPAAVHLDHGDTYERVCQAMEAGYTSVMIDGSAKPYEENADLARRVVLAAAPRGIPVEAELGRVGGKEDDLAAGEDIYTNPGDAADFVRRTGVGSLAVAIGTAHGVYAVKPRLDIGRLEQIRAAVDIPLVLHGASGLTPEDVRACVARGVCKVNFATELRAAYTEGVRETFAENPRAADPKIYGAAGREKVQALVSRWIAALGCEGRA